MKKAIFVIALVAMFCFATSCGNNAKKAEEAVPVETEVAPADTTAQQVVDTTATPAAATTAE